MNNAEATRRCQTLEIETLRGLSELRLFGIFCLSKYLDPFGIVHIITKKL